VSAIRRGARQGRWRLLAGGVEPLHLRDELWGPSPPGARSLLRAASRVVDPRKHVDLRSRFGHEVDLAAAELAPGLSASHGSSHESLDEHGYQRLNRVRRHRRIPDRAGREGPRWTFEPRPVNSRSGVRFSSRALFTSLRPRPEPASDPVELARRWAIVDSRPTEFPFRGEPRTRTARDADNCGVRPSG